jgi:lipopolysaccharide/colanic/teichoic acid biosynthesis glycosyltransferase
MSINVIRIPRLVPVRVGAARGVAFQKIVKRAVDYAGALVGLLLLGPALPVIAALIRLDSRGPVFFRQERLGFGGRPFRIWKFRTMATDAEARQAELESLNESAGGVLFKMRRDPRVTRIGHVLRSTSLDEVPQLFNVLRGEMSLVGPRPLPLRDCARLEEIDPRGLATRLQVRPGITGPWQVNGRSAVGAEQMLTLDADYIRRWSLGRDARILWQSIGVVLLRRGAC